VLDIADPTEPIVLTTCPAPEIRRGPLRYGPHNLHENRTGSWRSERFVFATYFNAGLVVYDLAEPAAPRLAAQWLPEALDSPQLNDLYVEKGGRVWVTDRLAGGLYAVEPDDGLAGLLRQ
jgi:hypothetical protein